MSCAVSCSTENLQTKYKPGISDSNDAENFLGHESGFTKHRIIRLSNPWKIAVQQGLMPNDDKCRVLQRNEARRQKDSDTNGYVNLKRKKPAHARVRRRKDVEHGPSHAQKPYLVSDDLPCALPVHLNLMRTVFWKGGSP